MGTSLTGLTPAATYQGLIKFADNSAIAATAQYLSDGLGNNLPISVSTSNVGIGSTSPYKSLSVRTSTSTEALEVRATTGNTGLRFSIADASVTTDGYSKGAIYYLNTGASSAIGTMAFALNNVFSSANVSTSDEKMRLTPNGSLLIGTTTESSRLFVKGSGSTSATTSLLVQNNSSTQLLKITDDGVIEAGSATATQFKVMNTEGLAISRDGSLDANIRIREFSGSGPVIKLNGNSTPTFKFIDSSNFQCILSHATWTGIGKGVTENTSAALQVESTTKGFLPPKMTDAQVRAISTPANGLVVYNTTIDHLCVYQAGAWVKISHSPM